MMASIRFWNKWALQFRHRLPRRSERAMLSLIWIAVLEDVLEFVFGSKYIFPIIYLLGYLFMIWFRLRRLIRPKSLPQLIFVRKFHWYVLFGVDISILFGAGEVVLLFYFILLFLIFISFWGWIVASLWAQPWELTVALAAWLSDGSCENLNVNLWR